MSKKENTPSETKEKLNAVFEKIGALSIIQRVGICVAVFALLGGGYYWFIFKQKQEDLARVNRILKTQENMLITFKKKAAQLPRFEKQMAMAQEKFNQAMQELPDKKELPNLLTQISSAGSKAGLIFHLFKPGNEIKREYYKELPISIKVVGQYHELTDFFHQILRIDRIVNINNVKVKSGNKDGPLEMSCQAVTYMFVEKKDTDAGKKRRR